MKQLLVTAAIMACLFAPLGAVRAGEFEGFYSLEYPELYVNLNFGFFIGGQWIGVNVNLPAEVAPDGYFDELYAEICEIIDALPFMSPEEKEDLKAEIRLFLDQLIVNWNEVVAYLYDELPTFMSMEQADWPFEWIMSILLEGAAGPWCGTIDLETGEFALLPFIYPAGAVSTPFGEALLADVVLIDGAFQGDSNIGSGNYLVEYELAVVNSSFIFAFGIGFNGVWLGTSNSASRDGASHAVNSILSKSDPEVVFNTMMAGVYRELVAP